MAKIVSKKKAREILRHGEIDGKPLTKKQRGYFGARAGGAPVRPARRKKTTGRPRGKVARRSTKGKSRKSR